MKARRLFIDQYGNRWYAPTVAALREQIGGGGSRVARIYCDDKAGRSYAVGYVIGGHWLTEYRQQIKAVSK